MAKAKSKLNEQESKKIEENILKENPEGLPESNIVIAKTIPEPLPLIKFTFFNHRDPGVALQFHYSSATCPLKQYTLYHGYDHELPQEIITHLESCGEPQYSYKPGPEGHPESYVKSKKYIFQCKIKP